MYAVIYLPDFRLQAALREEPERRGRAVALTEDGRITQLTDPARDEGVEEGLTATQAMARCARIEIRARSPAQEQTVAEMALQYAYCFSPNIEATAEGVCTLDLKGLPDSGDWESWAEKLLRGLEGLGLRARVGMAATPFLAWQAARQAERFLRVREAEGFVAGLPVEALEPAPELRAIVESWGVRNMGAFLALGRENIAERLGAEGVDLFERAAERTARPLHLTRPSETFEERREFEPAVELLEPLLFTLRRFVEELAKRLEATGRAVAALRLELALESGARYERTLFIPAPTCEAETLFRALQTHLENVRTDAPITRLRLAAQPGRAGEHQFELFDAALRDPNQYHETLARLTALLGAERAGTPRLENTHRPDSFRMEMEALTSGKEVQLTNEPPREAARGPALRRYRPPCPATVETQGEEPVWMRSAAFSGSIARRRGPWRLSGRWWDDGRWAREEWDVQTRDGDLYRLARQEEQWTVEGVFD